VSRLGLVWSVGLGLVLEMSLGSGLKIRISVSISSSTPVAQHVICRLFSVMFCIVAKRYVFPKNCLRRE